ncbi:MAG: hypothetical protein N3G78_04980 [Desulfobacterota bacterium]|nr:hypothetical protein [Thermodesulfobacteriota bacterium]
MRWRSFKSGGVLVGFLLFALFGVGMGMAWGENAKCLTCHRDERLVKTDARGNKIALHLNEEEFKRSVHGKLACTDCHTRIVDGTHAKKGVKEADRKVDCGACHEASEALFKTSVHSTKASIACKECHGYHYMRPLTDPKSTTYRTNLVQTCGACHAEESKQFAESVHGVGLSRGRPNHPTCTTCHGTHGIKPRTDPDSAVHERKIAITTCPQCHAAEQITREYRFTTKPVKSYYDSFHGLSYRGGDTFSANCASCHGVHDIRPSSDPKSMVHKDNLQKTCGSCHPGASVNFAKGKIHTLPDIKEGDFGEKVLGWVRVVYIVLIVTVLGGMLFFNFTDWLRKTIDRRPRD